MRNPRLLVTLAVLLKMALSGCAAAGQDNIKVDRTPLTYRDGGLYTRVSSIHGPPMPAEDGVSNLLTAERAASTESPWSFYIIQHNQPANAEEIRLIRQMAANGKKPILRVHLGALEKSTVAENIDDKERRLLEMMEGINPDWLYAITLDEERVFWGGWTEVLTGLYHRAKQHWPDLPVYQWWTPMEVPNARAESGWVALPADGWVIDLYGRPRTVFEKRLVKALETGKPVIHIVWSSPTWECLGCMGAPSWEDGGRQVFDDQMDVCRGYNVPVAHFCTQPPVNVDGERVASFRWGWHSVEPELRQWYRYLEVLAENNRRLPETSMGFRTLDETKFDWAHADDQPVGLSYSLDQWNRKQVTVAAAGDAVPLRAGEHHVSLGDADRYFRVVCVLDDSSQHMADGLGVAGRAGYTAASTIIFKIVPRRPLSCLAVAGEITVSGALGGSADIALSPDGQEWSEPISADTGQTRRQQLTVRSPGLGQTRFSEEPWYVRVRLRASSGTATRTAARLNSLQISAAIEPMLN